MTGECGLCGVIKSYIYVGDDRPRLKILWVEIIEYWKADKSTSTALDDSKFSKGTIHNIEELIIIVSHSFPNAPPRCKNRGALVSKGIFIAGKCMYWRIIMSHQGAHLVAELISEHMFFWHACFSHLVEFRESCGTGVSSLFIVMKENGSGSRGESRPGIVGKVL